MFAWKSESQWDNLRKFGTYISPILPWISDYGPIRSFLVLPLRNYNKEEQFMALPVCPGRDFTTTFWVQFLDDWVIQNVGDCDKAEGPPGS